MVRSPYVTWFSDVAGNEYAGIYVAIVFGVVNVSV
jgi:choline transport protein